MFIGRVRADRVVDIGVLQGSRKNVGEQYARSGWLLGGVCCVEAPPMRLDVTDAFSSGGLCYEQGERCKVSTVKKWTPSRRNSGA